MVVGRWSLVVDVVWDIVECVCTLHKTRACKLAARCTHADLETWACAPRGSTYPGPGMNKTALQIMIIATPPLAMNT